MSDCNLFHCNYGRKNCAMAALVPGAILIVQPRDQWRGWGSSSPVGPAPVRERMDDVIALPEIEPVPSSTQHIPVSLVTGPEPCRWLQMVGGHEYAAPTSLDNAPAGRSVRKPQWHGFRVTQWLPILSVASKPLPDTRRKEHSVRIYQCSRCRRPLWPTSSPWRR